MKLFLQNLWWLLSRGYWAIQNNKTEIRWLRDEVRWLKGSSHNLQMQQLRRENAQLQERMDQTHTWCHQVESRLDTLARNLTQ